MDSVTPEREPITYSLGLGERWFRIFLDEYADADVAAFLDVMFEGVPAEAAEQVRMLIATQFATQIAAARAKRGIELMVPAPKPGGAAMPGAAVLVAEVLIPTPVVPDATEVAARVARTTEGARTGMIAGSVAVRIDHSAEEDDADEAEQAEPTRRRIEYVIAVPNDSRWLSIDLSVQPSDGFDVEHVIAEFDQAVSELEWAGSDRGGRGDRRVEAQ